MFFFSAVVSVLSWLLLFFLYSIILRDIYRLYIRILAIRIYIFPISGICVLVCVCARIVC